MKRATTNGDEQDVFTGWRRVVCWTRRAGACARVKRGARRRERLDGKREAMAELHDTTADPFEVDPMFLSEVA